MTPENLLRFRANMCKCITFITLRCEMSGIFTITGHYFREPIPCLHHRKTGAL